MFAPSQVQTIGVRSMRFGCEKRPRDIKWLISTIRLSFSGIWTPTAKEFLFFP